jgi:hypothetical protein
MFVGGNCQVLMGIIKRYQGCGVLTDPGIYFSFPSFSYVLFLAPGIRLWFRNTGFENYIRLD